MSLKTYHQKKQALGTDVQLVITTNLPTSQEADRIFAALWLRIFRFERRFSRFIVTSELSKINQQAGQWTKVSKSCFDLLATAQLLAKQTNELFNPFILPALQRAGYKKSFSPSYQSETYADYSHRRVASINELLFSGEQIHIPPDAALDLGGIGKGYLADMLTLEPCLEAVSGYWFSLGGDVVASGHDENDADWEIYIQDAMNPDQLLDRRMTTKKSESTHIATSGTIARRISGNKHHIIDSETESPATTDVLLATVQAKTTTEADVLASCAVTLGSRKGADFLGNHDSVQGFMLQTGSKIIAKGSLSERALRHKEVYYA